MKTKLLKNISTCFTIIAAIIGIIAIASFAHEYSHVYDVKQQGKEVCGLCAIGYNGCYDAFEEPVLGWVKYYDNGNDIVSSEIRAYVIQVFVALILFFLMFNSQLFTKREDKE